MPTYDYRCTNPKCNLVFEDIKSINHYKVSKCPDCFSKAKVMFVGTSNIVIPASFHKPVPDSVIKAAQRANPNLERAR